MIRNSHGHFAMATMAIVADVSRLDLSRHFALRRAVSMLRRLGLMMRQAGDGIEARVRWAGAHGKVEAFRCPSMAP